MRKSRKDAYSTGPEFCTSLTTAAKGKPMITNAKKKDGGLFFFKDKQKM